MAEFVTDNSGGGIRIDVDGALSLDHFLIPKPEPLDQDEGNQHPRLNFDLEATVRSLVTRVGVLEAQIATCLESQPLLYRVFDKVNALEQRFKNVNGNSKDYNMSQRSNRGRISGLESRAKADHEETNSSTDTDGSDNDEPLVPGMTMGSDDSEPDQFEMETNHHEIKKTDVKKRQLKPKDPDWKEKEDSADSNKNAEPAGATATTRRRRGPQTTQPPCTCTICSKTVDRRHLKEHEFYHRFKALAEAPPTESRPRYRSRIGRRDVYSFCIEPNCKFNSKGRRRGLQETYHHYMKKHPDSDLLLPFACELCPPDPNGLPARFTTQNRLTNHCAKKHPSVPPPPKPKRPKPDVVFICEECGKQFQYKGTLKKHKGIHERSRNPNSDVRAPDPDPRPSTLAPDPSEPASTATAIADSVPPFRFELEL